MTPRTNVVSRVTHSREVIVLEDGAANEGYSPLVLTTHELLQEAEAVATRIAHSSLPARDAMVVLQLAARLGNAT